MKVLFRNSPEVEDEFLSARQQLGEDLLEYRTDVPANSTVAGRYSVMPFYKELEDELALRNSCLINTFQEHVYIRDMHWYNDINHLTPRTWFRYGYQNVPHCDNGWVVKGVTNSRKHQWDRLMYAPDRERLKDVMINLHDDALIGQQGLVIREYQPLERLGQSLNGLVFTNEWRFFFYGAYPVAHGFYWSVFEQAGHYNQAGIDPAGFDVAVQAAEIVGRYVSFFVVDVAKKQDGDWTVIEINDGQMSGLSMIDSKEFYKTLKNIGG